MPELPAAAAATPPSAPEKGPYTANETKTIKIAGPIEITLTTRTESSHVPPSPWAARPAPVDAVMGALRPLAELILSKLEDIRNAQEQEPSL